MCKLFNSNVLELMTDKEANGTAIASSELPLAGREPDNPAASTKEVYTHKDVDRIEGDRCVES